MKMWKLSILAVMAGCLMLTQPNAIAKNNATQQQGNATLAKAIQQLKGVRGELETAPHDYQGHRENAIKHIDQALEELNKALEVAPH